MRASDHVLRMTSTFTWPTEAETRPSVLEVEVAAAHKHHRHGVADAHRVAAEAFETHGPDTDAIQARLNGYVVRVQSGPAPTAFKKAVDETVRNLLAGVPRS